VQLPRSTPHRPPICSVSHNPSLRRARHGLSPRPARRLGRGPCAVREREEVSAVLYYQSTEGGAGRLPGVPETPAVQRKHVEGVQEIQVERGASGTGGEK